MNMQAVDLASVAKEIGVAPGEKRPWFLPLNHPPIVAAKDATHMRPDDAVAAVIVDGKARAYPWWLISNYHVCNDSIVISDKPAGYLLTKENAGTEDYPWYPYVPFVVILCEACTSVAAYLPALDEAPDNPLVFAMSERTAGGYSAPASFTVCDMLTQSRWHPFIGKAGSGPLKGRELRRIPAFNERWDTWVRDYPDTMVAFAGEEMRRRPHVRNLPAMDSADAVHSSVKVARKQTPEKFDHRLPPSEMILGIGSKNGRALAYPLSRLREAGGLVQMEFDEEPYLFVLKGVYRGLVFSRRVEGKVLDFKLRSTDPFCFVDTSGTEWNYLGEAVSGKYAGHKLTIIPDSYVSKWTPWSMAHPSATIVD